VAVNTYDYLIIGGGTAGAVIAARLAEDPSLRVALLEAGPSDEGDARILPVRDWMALLGTELDFDYRIEPQERGNSAIRHSRARVLGGCSSHNSCIAFRAPDGDMQRWQAEGAAGWGPEVTAPFFQRVFEKVHLEEISDANPLNRALVDAGVQAGLSRLSFANDGSFGAGVGLFPVNVKAGIRQSSSVAYLHPLSALPPNLDVLTDTTVTRILLDDDNRAIGVESSRGVIRAEREVILCAGAFDSPKLLLLSGIGPASHLAEIGIPLRVDLPGVGEHLLDHPEGVVVWESSRPITGPIVQLWEVGVFAHTGIDPDPLPDLMCHFGLMPFTWHTEPAGYPTAEWGFSLTPNVCRARSEGSVRLRSANPAEPPRIDFRYFTDPDNYDERVMVEGVKTARRIAAQPALKEWIVRELAPGQAVQSDAEISAYVRATANTVYHPAGTCKMGADSDPLAVVDSRLRVRGVPGLRVADASVFPSMTTVNPAITVFMIGERCAALVRGESADGS
jgi:choline oxidase